MRLRIVVLCALLMLGSFLASSQPAGAIPALQLYAEGATYDPDSESWVIEDTTDPFKLWVLGDVGKWGTIEGVKLSGAVLTSEISMLASIDLTRTTTALLTDPSTPQTPTVTSNNPSPDGAVPLLGDGSSLPSHGVFGPGVSFYEWYLGDFNLIDSPIGDFNGVYPSDFPDAGQINVYSVEISGFSWVQFDAYDHYYVNSGKIKYDKAPFSHNAGATPPIPEPATMLLLGTGLVGLVGFRKKFKK